MPNLFPFELVSPEKQMFSGEVISVQVPGSEGDFEVLAGHAPVLSTLRPGVLTVHGSAGQTRFLVQGGFAEANPQSLTVLASEIESVDGMTPERVRSEIDAALAVIANGASAHAVSHAQSKIEALKQLEH